MGAYVVRIDQRFLIAALALVVGAWLATGASVDPRGALTVDSLFAFIERGIANHSAVLQVTYDSALGYPKQIYSDGSVTYTVKDLVRVK